MLNKISKVDRAVSAGDVGWIGLTTGAAFLVSGAWYALFGRQLAELDPAYASGEMDAWVVPVELARSATVALAVTVLARRLGISGLGRSTVTGAGLWVAFPVVLLTGSVVHEDVPVAQAAIHAGDWLLKLVLISALVGMRQTRRARS